MDSINDQHEPPTSMMGPSGTALEREAREYVAEVLAEVRAPRLPAASEVHRDTPALAHSVFAVLTHRRFCSLSRRRTDQYRDAVVAALERRAADGGAFRFFLDIGPGYHATTRPGVVPLNYDVGLAELLLLYQVSSFCREVEALYQPGARFYFVVDNLCALRTNDIPVARTTEYVRRLRILIEAVGMSDLVEVVVESEVIDLDEYDRCLASLPVGSPSGEVTPAAVDNVARFLGRACTEAEAADRIERYSRTGRVTDDLLSRFVEGVHMTQRATGATLGFRSFPGGDQRSQVGEVALTPTASGGVRPLLLTTRNIDEYEHSRLDVSDILSDPLTHVTLARARREGCGDAPHVA